MTGAVLQQLTDILGEGPALQLMAKFGGTRIYVPIRPRLHQPLVKALGLEAVRALSYHFGGGQLAVPLGTTHTTAAKHSEIRRASETMSRNMVARLFGTTERNVRRVDNRGPRIDPRQASLFDD